MENTVKVRIIEDKCQGHAMCKIVCPEIFALREEDGHAYVLQDDVPPALTEQAEMAEQSCPEGAIELTR